MARLIGVVLEDEEIGKRLCSAGTKRDVARLKIVGDDGG